MTRRFVDPCAKAWAISTNSHSVDRKLPTNILSQNEAGGPRQYKDMRNPEQLLMNFSCGGSSLPWILRAVWQRKDYFCGKARLSMRR